MTEDSTVPTTAQKHLASLEQQLERIADLEAELFDAEHMSMKTAVSVKNDLVERAHEALATIELFWACNLRDSRLDYSTRVINMEGYLKALMVLHNHKTRE